MLRTLLRTACVSYLALFFVIFVPRSANGIAPPFVSDDELAKSDVVVVAKWNGAPWKDNSLIVDNVMKEYEVATEIEVNRVIKGDLKPGKHTILVGFRIGWSVKEPFVMSYMSTEVCGDAEATKDNLWFLNARRSRDGSKEYWCLDTYRGVQPLALETYFKALRAGDIADHIPELFRSPDEIVPLRTLELIAGGNSPWPYEPWSFVRPAQKLRPLKDKADLLPLLVEESKNQQVRRLATAVYAHLVAESSISFMRRMLEDEDPVVRAIALGALAQFKSSSTPDSMEKAVRGLKDKPEITCKLIERLAEWGDPAVVPALIEFLQDDGDAGRLGNDWNVPAIKSRAALRKITNHWFPFDVAASRDAWMKAREIQNLTERAAYLARIVPDDPKPWQATLVVEKDQVFVEITNRSQKTMTLAKQPTDITFTWSRGVIGFGVNDDVASDTPNFVRLDPGKSYRFELVGKNRKLLKENISEKSSSLDLAYISNGNKAGFNAWLGIISVEMRVHSNRLVP